MKILDMNAGNRAVWMNKKHPECLYLDIRPETEPDIVCDTRNLPEQVGCEYDLIVFDPPHCSFGPNSEMGKKYSHNNIEQIRDIIRGSGKEAHRVSKKEALMAFKWNDHDLKLHSVLNLISEYWEPLFGHWMRYGGFDPKKVSQTYWVMLRRKK